MAIQNTLKYLLFSEYLNPTTLKDIKKLQNKTRVAFEMKKDEFNAKFWDYFTTLKDELYRLNLQNEHGKTPTLKIEIFGGIYETSAIEDEIYKKYPHLNNDDFRQKASHMQLRIIIFLMVILFLAMAKMIIF